jgi:hypothetical protein
MDRVKGSFVDSSSQVLAPVSLRAVVCFCHITLKFTEFIWCVILGKIFLPGRCLFFNSVSLQINISCMHWYLQNKIRHPSSSELVSLVVAAL